MSWSLRLSQATLTSVSLSELGVDAKFMPRPLGGEALNVALARRGKQLDCTVERINRPSLNSYWKVGSIPAANLVR